MTTFIRKNNFSDMGEVGETDFSPSERRRKRSRSDFSGELLLLSYMLKNRSDLYPVPSVSYSTRQRSEFPWSQAITQNKVQYKKKKRKKNRESHNTREK